MKIKVQIRDITKAGKEAIKYFNLGPWCQVGALGHAWYEIEYDKAIELGILPKQ